MRALILCDVENWNGPPRPVAPPNPTPNASTTVVVAAATGWVNRRHVDYATVRELAALATERATDTPGAPFQLELALALQVPEAADALLVRLLESPGCSEGTGQFEKVALLSRDDGLRRAVTRRLAGWSVRHAPWTAYRGARREEYTWTRASVWSAPPGRPLRRRPIPQIVPAACTRDDGGPTVVVEASDAVARWAGTPVQLAPLAPLRAIAAAVDRAPARLTQIGVTSASTTGVARLCSLANGGQPDLAELTAFDGVEMVNDGAIPPAVGVSASVQVSSAGVGAVRLEWGDPPRSWTVRTRLPLWLVRAGAQMFGNELCRLVHDGRLQDDLFLGATPADTAPPVLEAAFMSLGESGTQCLIEQPDPGVQLTSWWSARMRDGWKQTAKYRVADDLLSRPLDRIPAVPAIRSGELVLRSAETPGVRARARVTTPIPANTIGLGRVRDRRCAILALGEPLETDEEVTTLAIQSLPARAWASVRGAAALPLEDLRRWPLLVHVADTAWSTLLGWGPA